jgi:hypothetical protein
VTSQRDTVQTFNVDGEQHSDLSLRGLFETTSGMVCSVCERDFSSNEALLKHTQRSKKHKVIIHYYLGLKQHVHSCDFVWKTDIFARSN